MVKEKKKKQEAKFADISTYVKKVERTPSALVFALAIGVGFV